MSKKSLYAIIIILLLCCFGVINLPIFNLGKCEEVEKKTMHVRLGFVSFPVSFNYCKGGVG